MAGSRPNNPRVAIQHVGPPWNRPPKLCERCWRMFEPGSHIDLEGTSAYRHPEFCACQVHWPLWLRKEADRYRAMDDSEVTGTKSDMAFPGPALWRIHHASPESLLQAVVDGCEFCNELLRRCALLSPTDAFPTCYLISKSDFNNGSQFVIRITGNQHGSLIRGFEFMALLYEQEHEHIEPAFSPVQSLQTSTTGSLECARLARHWLEECLETHSLCSSRSPRPWYPTRLLKIVGDYVYLIDTLADDEVIGGPYATLSYCWGTEKFDVLTAENISQFKAGLLIDDFLPTFKDAFYTVRRLSIEYIWIDCFCIVQDTLDWEVESAKMLEVYSNSVLNIGAEHASNPSQGLFATRNPDELKLRLVCWQPEDDIPQKLFALKSLSSRKVFNIADDGPLWRRAWVVQERMLSPRLLYFGEQQIWWNCPTLGTLRESCPTETSAARMNLVNKQYQTRKCALATTLRKDASATFEKTAVFDIWRETLKSYTGAELSHPTDKLRALQGVADLLASCADDLYLDGFFARSLLKQMCFSFFPREERISRSGRAPTYSWAAWDGRIKMNADEIRPGEMLATCVSDLRLATKLPSPLYCIGRLVRVQCRNRGFVIVNQIYITPCGEYDDPHKSKVPAKALFLPVYLSIQRLENDTDSVFGILVTPSRNNTFRRVGAVSFNFHHIQINTQKDGTANVQDFLYVCAQMKPQLIPMV